MSGTKQGGIRTAATNKANDPDYYRKLGSIGGKARNPNKGFGSNRDLASEAGRKGGKRSWDSRKANSKSSDSTLRTARTTDQSAKSSSTSNGGDLDRKTSNFLAKFRMTMKI